MTNDAFSVSTESAVGAVVNQVSSPPDSRRLSPAVRVFASLSGAVPADVRRKRLAEFPDTLSGTEVSALTGFLATTESRIPGVSPRSSSTRATRAAGGTTRSRRSRGRASATAIPPRCGWRGTSSPPSSPAPASGTSAAPR